MVLVLMVVSVHVPYQRLPLEMVIMTHDDGHKRTALHGPCMYPRGGMAHHPRCCHVTWESCRSPESTA